jgi:hypothetical protein
MLYDECDEVLKNNFSKDKVILYTNGIGKFNEDNILIKEFCSKFDCCVKDNISNKTLNKALAYNLMYKNHYYRYIDHKLMI